MTEKTQPTDAELLDAADDFRSQYKHGGTTFDEFDALGFARAVLAKWGTHAVAGEPVAIYHGRCTIDCGAHGHLDMELLKMIPAGARLYTTPQPTQPPIECNTEELKKAYTFGWWSALEKQRETAQAGAVPLTPDQVAEIADAARKQGEKQ